MTSRSPVKENALPGKETRFAVSIPPSDRYFQDYIAPKITSEVAIEIFGEVARQPVCDNLKYYCLAWNAKKNNIAELERIIPTLPVVENSISLRGLYEVMLPRAQRELRQIERHIRRLQHCLELLEGRQLFSRPSDAPGHIDTDALKERLDIADVISQWVGLRQSGNTYKGRCPFHNDRAPSFVVYPATKSWWCFACNEGGDVITFVQKIKNCSFREAIAEAQRV